MIQSFRHKDSEDLWNQKRVAKLQDVADVAYRKLTYLNAASRLSDLRVPPGNRLEQLKGNRSGQHSIRVNRQYRICFTWTENGLIDVEVTKRYESIRNETMSKTKDIAPVHPGEILKLDFLGPMGITEYRLAKDIHVPQRRINEIIHLRRGISTDTALRLARYFGTSEELWVNLQSHYNLLKERDRLAEELASIEPREAA